MITIQQRIANILIEITLATLGAIGLFVAGVLVGLMRCDMAG